MSADREESALEVLQTLSNDISIDILRFLLGKKWCIASDVSKSLGIHTTTAQKYLSKMHQQGILQRRVRVCKTRSAFEYLLKSPKIQIELDLSKLTQGDDVLPDAVYKFFFSTFFAIVVGARRIGGSQIDGMVKNAIEKLKPGKNGEALLFLKCLERYENAEQSMKYFQHESRKGKVNASSIKSTFFQLINDIIGSYEAHIGKSATKRIVEVSVSDILRENDLLIERYGFLADLPKEYFGFMEEKA